TKKIGDNVVLDNISFTMNKDDKIALVGRNDLANTTLLKILMGEIEPDAVSFKWGVTTSQSYFPRDNSEFFDGNDLTLIEWLRQYSLEYDTDKLLRAFLGRM